MTKELSIRNIKKEITNALLDDMRIMNMFGNKNVKKASDYIGKNIFCHLNDDVTYLESTDIYINYDATSFREHYDLLIYLKAHNSLLDSKDGVNKLDELTEYIEEIVKELYPNCKCYENTPIVSNDKYGRKHLRFALEAKRYNKVENYDFTNNTITTK